MSEVPSGDPQRASLASQLDLMVPDAVGVAGEVESTVFLVGLSGRQAGVLFRLRGGENLLGRSSRSLVLFEEKAVSQHHASVVYAGGRAVITDLGSTNGTFVNDVRLGAPVELVAGDVIRIGKTAIGFLTDAKDEQQHTRALSRVNDGIVPFSPSSGGLARPTASWVAVDTGRASEHPVDVAIDRFLFGANIFKRYAAWLLVGLALGAGGGAVSVKVKPPKAVAECRVFLKHQGKDDPHSMSRYSATTGEYFRFPIDNFISPDLIKATLSDMGGSVGSASVAAAKGSLLFLPEGEGVYRGTFYHPSADYAERFLAEHLRNYLESEINKSIRVLSQEVELLRKQYDENEKTLQTTEKELQKFKEEHLAGLPENAVSQLQSRAALQERSVVLQADLARYSSELAHVQRQHASGDAVVAARVQSAHPYEAGLARVRQGLAAARSEGLTDAHPRIVQLKSEESELLALSRSAVHAETSNEERRANRDLAALGDRLGQLQVLAGSTQTELGLVETRLKEIASVASSMPAVEATLAELTRSLTASKGLHQHLHEQLKSKELKLEFERASIAGRYDLVDAPSAPEVSMTTTALLRAGIGAGLGLVLAILAAAVHFGVGFLQQRLDARRVN